MRRARISIKPNVRPGGRSVAPAAEDKCPQESTAVEDNQQTPSPSPQPQLEVKESAVATGDGNVPGSPSEKASLNTNDGAPSSTRTPATTAPQRRSKFSATPNLARPKIRSAAPPSTGKTASLQSEPSKTSSLFQAAKSFPQSSISVAVSRDDSQNSAFSDATAVANCPPSSPCLPSTPGCPASPLSTQSHQKPSETPQKIPNEDLGPQEGASPASCVLSPYVKLSRVDGADSPLRDKISSDKQRVLRALKLKELMNLEKKKERMLKKSGRHKREHCIELDRDKMTLADFIYYLPESNPMKSSLSTEETQTQITTPPSPTLKNVAEADKVDDNYDDDDDDDDADDAEADADMLVPKVRVAEDGSLILDEESLTVRVERKSDTVVENSNPLFERGSTTTYTSFKERYYVKSWSLRETDMFYLAISMVGTDFSMMAQLLTHRNRAEIKHKFRKEEREHAWRVDKAFRNKRPYDAEFFSFLLKRILKKDKEKGKGVKLVMKSNKTKKGKGGKKAKRLDDEDAINDEDYDELCSVDSVSIDLGKENEDSCNVKKANLPSRMGKKRKRIKDTKPSEMARDPKKKNKTQKKAKSSVEDEDNILVCGDNDSVEVDPVDADRDDQSCMPVPKKGDQEGQEEKADVEEKANDKEKHQKKKKKKKKKVQIEEPSDGESGTVNKECSEASTIMTKKRKHSKKCVMENEEPPPKKSKTKTGKTPQEECSGSESGAKDIDVSTAAGTEEDQGEKLIAESAAQEVISQSSSKHSKRPLPSLKKKKAKKCSEPKATAGIEDTVEEPQDESWRESQNKSRILRLAEEQLRNQPVVVLERTPPRPKDSQSSSERQDQPQCSQSPQRSPGRQMRAEKVKRNLTASDDGSEASKAFPDTKDNQGEMLIPDSAAQEEISQSSSKHALRQQMKVGKVKRNLTASQGEEMDRCQTGSETSQKDMSSSTMGISQDSKEMEEGFDLQQFLTSSKVNGQALPKRDVVSASQEEMKRYLRIQEETAVEESAASDSRPDTKPAEGHHVGEHGDGPEEEEQRYSGVTLEKTASKDAEMKETNTASVSGLQNIAAKKRFSNPTSSLSQAAQSCCRPINVLTTECSENPLSVKQEFTQLLCSSPVEVLNACLEEEHRKYPEEEGACGFTPEEKVSVVQDDVTTAADDLPSLTTVETPPRAKDTEGKDLSFFLHNPSDKDVTERRTQLEKSPSHTSENEGQITDREEHYSEPSESEMTDTIIEEPQTELKRVIPASYSSDERCCQFAKSTPSLEWASQIMINPLQTSEHNEDSSEEHQNHVKARHCNLDHDIETFSREDKLESEVDSQECKLDEDLLCPVPSLGSTQTIAPEVPVDRICEGNKEQIDPVLSDASSEPFEPHSPVSSLSDHPTELTNIYEMNTMMLNVSAAEDIQIPDEQDSEKQDGTEERSAVSDDWPASLDRNNKTPELSDSAGVETDGADNQSEEEPTFILTLYEIPTSQLFDEAVSGQPDTLPYELQPAQIQTPSLFTGSSQPLSFTLEASSASLHMETEETPPHKDDSLVPLSNDAADAKEAGTQLKSSQESGRDDVNCLISPPKMLSCSSAVPTDVLKLEEIPTETLEIKAPAIRRSKIKVKSKLKPCVKAGSLRNYQFDNAQGLQSSHAKVQSENEYIQKTVESTNEDSEREAHPVERVLLPEDMRNESHVKCTSPFRADHQMDKDSDDLPVHSTMKNESVDKTEDGCEGVSHMVLADAFILPSGEMGDVFKKEVESRQKPEDLSVSLPESDKALPAVNDQNDKMAGISKKDTCREASSVKSASQEPSGRDARPGVMASSSQCLTPFPTAKTSACADSSPEELKVKGGHEDVLHTLLPEIYVPVSNEMEDDVPTESESPVLQREEESQRALAAEAEQETNSHEVSHMLLTDILIPVCEDLGDDLSQKWMTPGERSPHDAGRAQVREDPDRTDMLCYEELQPSNVGPSVSPWRKRPTQGKDKLLVKMTFPKMKTGDSPTSGQRSQTVLSSILKSEEEVNSTLNSPETEPKLASTQCCVETFTSETSRISIHSIGLHAVKVEKATDTKRPANNETEETTVSQSVSVEWKTPSCRIGTLRPKSKISKRKDDCVETDPCPSGSTQISLAAPQQSMDPRAEEWSFRGNMLPMDSDEIDNWCEGVSHMLLSDAFVPVSEETGEDSTDVQALVSSSLHQDEENALCLSQSEKTPSEISDDVDQLYTTSELMIEESNESLMSSQAKKSPGRRTFQMMLRSPERRLKDQTHVLKSPQAAPATPQRAQTSKVKGSMETPTRQHTGEISSVCRVQLERLSTAEICAAQCVLQPMHHSTPVTEKRNTRGSEMHKASLALHGIRSPGLQLQADEELTVPPGYSPRVALHRISITASNANTSIPTSSPARVFATASRLPGDHQSPQNSPPAEKVSVQVSQFFLDDIFTEVVDPD